MGIDLGTANTLVYIEKRGIVLREPTVIAKNIETGEIEAVGQNARKMIGRTPGSISVIRPMRDGVIADYDTTATMMSYFMKKALKNRFFLRGKPKVIVSVPSGITKVEERAVVDATKEAGAKEVFVISEPFLAAIGSGLPVWEPTGSMIVDIGGGTTEVALISLGGIVMSKSVRVAGDDFDDDIIQWMRRKHQLAIGLRTAEEIKIQIGYAGFANEDEMIEVRGRDLVTGLPKTVTIDSNEIAHSLGNSVEEIIDAVLNTLEQAPPELAADIIDRGIVLTGGGCLLKNLDEVISERTNTPVFITEEPLDSVVIGTGKTLRHVQQFKNKSHPLFNQTS